MGAPGTRTYSRYSPYLERYVQLRVADNVVLGVSFPEDAAPKADMEHELLDRVERYLSGTGEDEFEDVAVQWPESEMAERVLKAVRAIPYGNNASVEDLLRSCEDISGEPAEVADEIRRILDTNPSPLIIPDHRVRDGPSAAPPSVEQRLRSLERIVT